MNLFFINCQLKKIKLLFATLLFTSATLQAQCPADPITCTPNIVDSSMPDTAFICEGVTSVLLNPQISGGNFNWFRETTFGVFDPMGLASSLANVSVLQIIMFAIKQVISDVTSKIKLWLLKKVYLTS